MPYNGRFFLHRKIPVLNNDVGKQVWMLYQMKAYEIYLHLYTIKQYKQLNNPVISNEKDLNILAIIVGHEQHCPAGRL